MKSALDAKRRDLAKRAVVDQLIAVESEDDHEGFTWWLCVVTKAAYQPVRPLHLCSSTKEEKADWISRIEAALEVMEENSDAARQVLRSS